MYKTIKSKKSIATLYAEKLVSEKVIDQVFFDDIKSEVNKLLEAEFAGDFFRLIRAVDLGLGHSVTEGGGDRAVCGSDNPGEVGYRLGHLSSPRFDMAIIRIFPQM